jgi:uncharacterized protein (TIGR04255 family)
MALLRNKRSRPVKPAENGAAEVPSDLPAPSGYLLPSWARPTLSANRCAKISLGSRLSSESNCLLCDINLDKLTENSVNATLQLKPIFPPRQYPHAPIKEALIDLQVKLPPDQTIERLQRIHDKIRADYPIMKKRVFFEGEISAGEQLGASAKQRHMGFAFYSTDGLYVFQARLDGFTFSRLAPYESWENLRDQAKRYWDLYRQYAAPVHIQRVGLRYINQINIPSRQIDFDDYFLTIPKIGPGLPQVLREFLMQLQLPQEDLGALAIVTQTIAPPPEPNTVSVILDIDIFVQQQMSDENAWALVEALRVRKNDVFEGSITDRTRELFN